MVTQACSRPQDGVSSNASIQTSPKPMFSFLQVISSIAFKALNALVQAVIYIPLKVINGLCELGNILSQLFNRIILRNREGIGCHNPLDGAHRPTTTIHADGRASGVYVRQDLRSSRAILNDRIQENCELNNYLIVWNAVKEAPDHRIDDRSVLAVQSMLRKLRESRDHIQFPALNQWVVRLVSERNLS